MFCLLVSALTWQSYTVAVSTIVKSSINDIKQDLSSLQREMEKALKKNNLDDAKTALSAREINHYYQIILFTDDQNNVIHATDPSFINRHTNHLKHFDSAMAIQVKADWQPIISISSDQKNILAYFPLRLERSQGEISSFNKGILFLEYDLVSRKNLAWQHVKNSVIPSAFLLLVAMAILLFFIKRYILLPFEHIKQATGNFSKKPQTNKLHINGHGEFADLSAVLNKMAIKRRLYEHKLQQSTQNVELALKELAEQKYALDQHSIVDITDVAGTITYANDKFCAISEYSRDELIGSNHRIIHSNVHPKEFFRNMYETIEKGSVWHGEICNRSKNGNIYWVETTIVPFIGDNKKPQSYVAIRTDITKRKIAQEKLIESEERFQLAMSVANDGIWDWDLVTNNTLFDDRYYTMAGYRSEEYPADLSEWEKRIHPDDLEHTQKTLNQYIEGKQLKYQTEFRYKRKDDSYMWIRAKGEFVAYDNKGNPTRMVGTHSDITVQKKIEIELNESKNKLTALVNQIPYGIQEFDTRGIITFGNPAYCKIMGGELDDFVGRYFWEFEIDDESKNNLKNRLLDVIRDQPEPESYLTERKRLDGQIITLEIEWNYQKNSQGIVTGFITIISDVTQQRKAEWALQRAQRMEAIGQLTGGIAHDFNNILGVIIGNLDLLNSQFEDNQRAHKRIVSASKAASRAEDLTKKLLGFSRNKVTESKISNINHTIENMDDVIRHILNSSVEISYELQPDLWLTQIDRGDLQDVLLNLVRNAHDAMQIRQRAKLIISTSNAELDEIFCLSNEGSTPGEYILLSICDNGEGIAKETLPNIFEPFFTTKIQGKGTGLGLAMVFGFVKRSGGYIQVDSKRQQATTFKLFLPRNLGDLEAKPMISSAQKNEDIQLNLKGSEIILIVDDEPGLLELAQTNLQSLGYQVLTAQNGIQALEQLSIHSNIDLVFSDIVMPGGISGYQLAEKISDEHPKIKILLTSGYTGKAENNYSTQSHSPSELLKKPYHQKQLAICVRKLLDGKNNPLEVLNTRPQDDGAITWTNSLNIGVKAIDEDHKILIDLFNKVNQQITKEATDYSSTLEELSDFCTEHFVREEAVMEACNFPDLKNHKQIHHLLLKQMRQMLKQAQQNQLNPAELYQFLFDWLVQHIQSMDAIIEPYAKGKSEEIKRALFNLNHEQLEKR